VIVKVASNLKKGLKTEHIPIALLETLKTILFCVSPLYIDTSAWIFLSNGELIVN